MTDDRDARLAALLSVDISQQADEASSAEVVEAPPAAVATATAPAPAPVEPAPARTPTAAKTPRSGGTTGAVAWAALAVLVFAGVGLGYAGVRIVRSSTEGQVLAPIDDPTAPGFEAVVDPTPTLVIIHDVDGLVNSLAVLTLPDRDSGGGGVVLVPTRTVHDVPFYGRTPINVAYDLGDPAFQSDTVGLLLNAAMQESAVVDAARWADLVEPVAPIEIDNPNDLLVDGELRFPAGEIELAAEDVGPYLEATVEDESDLARLFRHEIFWNAWLAAVAADGTDAAVPGELDRGVGRFVRALARGTHDVETLPVEDETSDAFGESPAFLPDTDRVDALVERLIPLPQSPAPGVRARLRVLNGTRNTEQAATAAARLPPAGVAVTLIGNVGRFGVETTTIEFAGEEFRDQAEAVAEILGVGEVIEDRRPSDSVDITVTLGSDYG